MNYDIHVYFRDENEREEALKIKSLLEGMRLPTFPLVERPIGPHPLPMFEAHVSSEKVAQVREKLRAQRKLCSILIHEKTGDHLYDHTKGASWLGDELELDIEFLKSI